MVPATVPVWSRTCVALLGNNACLEPAGMVNAMVRPPEENCTAGSLANTSEVNVRVRVPLKASA